VARSGRTTGKFKARGEFGSAWFSRHSGGYDWLANIDMQQRLAVFDREMGVMALIEALASYALSLSRSRAAERSEGPARPLLKKCPRWPLALLASANWERVRERRR